MFPRAIYRDDLIPRKTAFVGYARSNLTVEDIRASIAPYIKLNSEEDQELFEEFIKQNAYVQGSYDKAEDFIRLESSVRELEGTSEQTNRLYYLALPPTVFETVTKLIHDHCMTDKYADSLFG